MSIQSSEQHDYTNSLYEFSLHPLSSIAMIVEVLHLMNKDRWCFINKNDESNPLDALFKIPASHRELVMVE